MNKKIMSFNHYEWAKIEVYLTHGLFKYTLIIGDSEEVYHKLPGDMPLFGRDILKYASPFGSTTWYLLFDINTKCAYNEPLNIKLLMDTEGFPEVLLLNNYYIAAIHNEQ